MSARVFISNVCNKEFADFQMITLCNIFFENDEGLTNELVGLIFELSDLVQVVNGLACLQI